MIAVLVTGYLTWSAFPVRFDPARAALMDIRLFGVYQLQGIHAQADRAVSRFWEHAHAYLAWALGALVAVHILAALRHQFIKRNTVMRRMWSGQA
jgi:cytochrome b561